METTLPVAIKTVEQAENFLNQLVDNGEAFHPDDDPNDILWECIDPPTPEECDHLGRLMDQILQLEGFDPYEHLLDLV